jgi:ubiquinone/menaquinone biosynthesis C-methylase UbiE
MSIGAIYSDKNIHESWESVYRSNPLQDEFNERIMDRVMKLLDPAPDALFLDAGCGSGSHTLRIAQRGFRCVGADISGYVLKKAEEKVAAAGLQAKASVSLQNLEDLSFEDRTFDFVHCRGVLMHIPDWERALGELCRVLKPGGKIVIFESNRKSLEARLVQLARRFREGVSRVVETPGGLEFWSEKDGNPFVVRIADIRYLTHFLESRNFEDVRNIATEFWDINRFPGGVVRNGVIRFNRLWFSLGLPPLPSVVNAVVAEKT